MTWDTNSYTFAGWTNQVFYCRASYTNFTGHVNLPAGAAPNGGNLRLYIIDADNYAGGRVETIVVNGQTIGTYQNFQTGEWITVPITASQAATGKITIQVSNARSGSNCVLSILEWLES
jgi:hypothetical protein